MPIRTAVLLAAGGLAVTALTGCGDSETNDAATTTSSSVDTTDDTTSDTELAGLDDSCVETIVDYFNNDLDLTRLADPLYVDEVTADLGECNPSGVNAEQAAEISGRLEPEVVAAISGGAAPAEDPSAPPTPGSTP